MGKLLLLGNGQGDLGDPLGARFGFGGVVMAVFGRFVCFGFSEKVFMTRHFFNGSFFSMFFCFVFVYRLLKALVEFAVAAGMTLPPPNPPGGPNPPPAERDRGADSRMAATRSWQS